MSVSSPDDANRAARHGGRVRRQFRHEQSDVRIERAVVEAERQLAVGFLVQRDAADPGDREARRRDVGLAIDFLSAKRERAGDQAHRLLADRQLVDPEPHVVARVLERAAAGSGKFDDACRLRLRKRERRDAFGRNTPAVGVEGIRAVPSDEGRTRDRAGRFGDARGVEPDAVAVEPERRRAFLERLAIGDAVVDRHGAESNRPLVVAGEMKLAAQPS